MAVESFRPFDTESGKREFIEISIINLNNTILASRGNFGSDLSTTINVWSSGLLNSTQVMWNNNIDADKRERSYHTSCVLYEGDKSSTKTKLFRSLRKKVFISLKNPAKKKKFVHKKALE